MSFILSKILIFFLKPIVWIAIIILLAAGLKKHRKKFAIVACFLFFFFSNSFIVGVITNWYEASYPPNAKYDVGIVLGGYSAYNKKTKKIAFSWASDRLFQAISLYKEGKIDKILLSSGSANLLDTTIKEADLTVDFLHEIGLADSAIMVENMSRNTLENAKNSLAIIKRWKPDAKVLVITSAWHVPRARLIFDRFAKSSIDYYPTNFSGKTDYELADFILPNAAALSAWELLLKEWVGYLVDRIRN
ncbi:YdcF family protein [Pedobacter sandarakinus]|uniref:YdcF family protein n=1 Tax=Pedobacter sandarakinus TaxID=353156 RepID=UPI002247412A|nr:YdcF family protein [Pedobacter sandarakinus]MCX2575840.1 YdcF family protein [Pedobacter sandarakinus]